MLYSLKNSEHARNDAFMLLAVDIFNYMSSKCKYTKLNGIKIIFKCYLVNLSKEAHIFIAFRNLFEKIRKLF